MKTLVISLLLIASAAQAKYAGKLDLASDPEAIALRELNDGMWLIGAQKNIWHLVNLDSNAEVLHLAGFYATRLEGQNPAYGPALGTTAGPLISWLADSVDLINQDGVGRNRLEVLSMATGLVHDSPPWMKKIGDWLSFDVYGGYRPSVAADQHHIIYGFGGKVRIPFGSLASWAKGSPWNGSGANTLGL